MDLWILLGSVGLAWALIMVAATPMILKRGPTFASGNREGAEEPTGFAARAKRASSNMNENLPLFAALVLIAHVSGQAGSTSALGAQIFLGFRVLHAGLYLAGVPWLRTAAWMGSIAGMGVIVGALF